eukprot:TCALIF_07393-PA protein Name:"Similar to rab3-GEF MAP kinase-activating death domain protein (Drosophila melanogaster)" AED:0.23 eAED:0.14 QI:0/0.48/0.46/0.88/0.96/0.96/26/0/2175
MTTMTDPFKSPINCKSVCPRLIDYLCIVGSRNYVGINSSHAASVQTPELLRRYPPSDHKDFPLPLNMVSFCQPEGCVSVGPKKSGIRDTTSFLFILTDKDSGMTRYGTCLNFYRPVELDQSSSDERELSYTDPTPHGQLKGDKSSDSAFSSDYRSSVSQVPHSDSDRDTPPSSLMGTVSCPATNGFATKGGPSKRRQRQRERKVDPLSEEEDDFATGSSHNNGKIGRRRKEPSRIFSLTSLCFLSHHPFASNFRHCLMVLRQMIEMCEAACSPKRVGGSTSGASTRAHSNRPKRRSTLWSYLIGPPEDFQKHPPSSLLLHDIREIETWILRLLSAPVPVPGRTRVELEIVPRRDRDPGGGGGGGGGVVASNESLPMIFALPDHTRFSLCDFPLHLPLELLGVITLILLEKKIVIQSRDYSALTISILSLTQLLYPLEYMFPIIPLLPISMSGSEQLLLAPTPYIIGLPTSFLACKRNMKLPEEIWLVDLDAATIVPPNGTSICDIPTFPEPEAKALKTHLKQALASMSIQPIKNFDDMPLESLKRLTADKDVFASPPVCGYNPFIYGNDVDSVDVATRIAMIRFFYSGNMLAHFSEHTRTLRLYPRPIVAFQVSSFLKSRTKLSPFITQFSQSQAIECFAEWMLMPTNVAFQRVNQGIFDPKMIGDKPKWFAHDLEQVRFVVWDDQSSLTSLLLNGVSNSGDDKEPATDESGCDSEDISTSSSCSSLSDLVTELMSEENNEKRNSIEYQQRALLSGQHGRKGLILSSGLDISLIPSHPSTSECNVPDPSKGPDNLSLVGGKSPASHMDPSCRADEEDSSLSETDQSIAREQLANLVPTKSEEHDDVFSSESENSVSMATTKTMCNKLPSNTSISTLYGVGNISQGNGNGTLPGSNQSCGITSSSPSFGSNLSLASSLCSDLGTSTTESNTPRTKPAVVVQTKTGPTVLPKQGSTSSNESQKSIDHISPTDDVAQELFNSIEQFTLQAKQAAETFEFSKITTAGKSAAMAAGVKKDALQDFHQVSKSAMNDLSKSVNKKKDLFKALGESMSGTTDPETEDDSETAAAPRKSFSLMRRSSRELMKSIGRDLIGSGSADPVSETQPTSSPHEATTSSAHRVGTPVPKSHPGGSSIWRFNHNSISLTQAIANRTSPRPSVSGEVSPSEDTKHRGIAKPTEVKNGSAKKSLPKVPPRPRSMQRALSRDPPPVPPRPKSEERAKVDAAIEEIRSRRGPRPRLRVAVDQPLPSHPTGSSAGNTPVPTTAVFLESEAWAARHKRPSPSATSKEATTPTKTSNGTPPLMQKAPSSPPPPPSSPKLKRLASHSSSISTPSMVSSNLPAAEAVVPSTPVLTAQNGSGQYCGVDVIPPADVHTIQPILPPSKPGLIRSNSTLSTTSNVSQTTQEFLMSLGSDLSGLASTTSTLFGDLFGRRGLAERSSLIRHPSSKQKQEDISRYQEQFSDFQRNPTITPDNHSFIKDIVDQVFQGDGISWLKHNRLRKLMEDESHRMLAISKLNRALDGRSGPDDHMTDVCVDRAVWKGLLKIVLAIVHGLEVSVSNSSVGGLTSAFHVLAIAHTHYWARDPSMESSTSVSSGLRASSLTSTPCGSRDNLHKIASGPTIGVGPLPLLQKRSSQMELGTCKLIHDNLNSPSGSSQNSGESDSISGQSDLLKFAKRNPLSIRGQSIESSTSYPEETESDSQSMTCSETGSFMVNPAFRCVTKSGHHADIRSVVSDSEIDPNHFPPINIKGNGVSPDIGVLLRKSSLSSGFRFHGGALYTTVEPSARESGKIFIFEGILQSQRGSARRGSLSLGGGSYIWDCDQFWEDMFCDSVAHERDVVGMDTGAGEMMERYRNLSGTERKRLEQDEDRLLSTMLYNMVAYMVMMSIEKKDIKKKARRLLGKSHIGLIHSQEINQLLDQIQNLTGNDIDLKPLPSRQMNRQTFSVHLGTDVSGDLQFLEVREDGLVLRTINGAISDRWFFERLVNMTYSPRTKVICLWRRSGGQTQLHKFHTKKCKVLYYCIKEAMERAAAKGTGMSGLNMELGGEFPVEDLNTGEGGLLQVCMEGIGLLFATTKFFVRLDHIRKCFTQKGGVFVLEEFSKCISNGCEINTVRVIKVTMLYRSQKPPSYSAAADQICYSVLCVFSYVAAGQKQQKRPSSVSSTTSTIRSRVSSVRKM